MRLIAANEDKIRKIIDQSIDRVLETIMVNTKCDKNDIGNSAEKKKFIIMGLKPFSFLMALIIAISEGSNNSRNRR